MKIFEITLYQLIKINDSYNISPCFLRFFVVMLYENGNIMIPYNVSLHSSWFPHVPVYVRYNSHRLRIYRSTRFRVPPSR